MIDLLVALDREERRSPCGWRGGRDRGRLAVLIVGAVDDIAIRPLLADELMEGVVGEGGLLAARVGDAHGFEAGGVKDGAASFLAAIDSSHLIFQGSHGPLVDCAAGVDGGPDFAADEVVFVEGQDAARVTLKDGQVERVVMQHFGDDVPVINGEAGGVVSDLGVARVGNAVAVEVHGGGDAAVEDIVGMEGAGAVFIHFQDEVSMRVVVEEAEGLVRVGDTGEASALIIIKESGLAARVGDGALAPVEVADGEGGGGLTADLACLGDTPPPAGDGVLGGGGESGDDGGHIRRRRGVHAVSGSGEVHGLAGDEACEDGVFVGPGGEGATWCSSGSSDLFRGAQAFGGAPVQGACGQSVLGDDGARVGGFGQDAGV